MLCQSNNTINLYVIDSTIEITALVLDASVSRNSVPDAVELLNYSAGTGDP